MSSLHLWRRISRLDTGDPIALRASQSRMPETKSKRRFRISRWLKLVAALALIALLAYEPGLVVLVFALPMALITLMVISPLLLPIATWVFGAALVAGIIDGINREKRQHTYELLCSSAVGAQKANLSFATGILHRGGGFAVLRWGSLATLRCGAAILLLLLTLILWQLVVKPGGVGVAQARLIIVPALLLLHYYAHLVQTLALGLSLGILCGGLPLAKSEATMLAICLYMTGTALPVAAGALMYLAGRGMLLEGDEAGLLLVECGAALVVAAARELGARLAWRGLGVRFGGERLG